jgi:T5SS/PEP-CTERM-associated repeat protein
MGAGLTIGREGSGTLSISRCGSASVWGNVILGDAGTGYGSLSVAGQGSSLQVGDPQSWPPCDVTVGREGSGSLSISGGGAMTVSGNLILGDASTGSGTASVADQGSSLQVGQNLQIGTYGTGAFAQSGGQTALAGDLVLGAGSGSTGKYTLNGNTSLIVHGSAYVGFSGTGTFVQTGGHIIVTGDLRLAVNPSSQGTYAFQGGTLTVQGNLVNNGTMQVGPRQNLPDYIDVLVSGNYKQTASGNLTIVLPANPAFRLHAPIDVVGEAKLDGTLDVQLEPGFQPTVGETFDLMSYGSIAGRFATFKGSQIDSERFFGLNYHEHFLEAMTLRTPKRITAPGGSTLVLVTHGWNGREGQSAQHQWVDTLAQDIVSSSSAGVDVMTLHWPEYAGTANLLDTFQAAQNGREIGESLGNWLAETGALAGKTNVQAGKTNVHLISHSAGVWLVDAVADVVRQKCPGVTIQLTLLDAMDDPLGPHRYGAPGSPRPVLGDSADWAEQYVSMDFWTGDFTNSTLPGAFNMQIDALGRSLGYKPDHSLPYIWYDLTVQSPDTKMTGGWGFRRSYEFRAGDLPTHNTYPRGNPPTGQPLVLLPDGTCAELPVSGTKVDFSTTSNVKSDTGTVTALADGTGFEMTTGSPVWVTSFVEVAELVNFLRFDLAFPSGSDGLLSVWADGLQVFQLSQTDVPDTQVYTTEFFWLGQTLDLGTHTLLFRLDPSDVGPSSVSISNVEFAYAQPTPEPATVAILALGGLATIRRRRM